MKTITIKSTIQTRDLRNMVKKFVINGFDRARQLYLANYMSAYKPVADVLSETPKAYLVKVQAIGFFGEKRTEKITQSIYLWIPKTCCEI